jgi:integrase
MKRDYPQHYALAATLAFTGLRFCHASALRWEDLEDAGPIIRVQRKQVRGHVGAVSRKKRAPREIPLVPVLATILREHRMTMLEKQAPGMAEGWMFPSEVGTLRTPGGLWKAWRACLTTAGISHRFTVHGLRRTFNDLARRAGVDAVVTRSLTGHVTERMQEHYSTVALDEKRAALAGVVQLIPGARGAESGAESTPENESARKAEAPTGRTC